VKDIWPGPAWGNPLSLVNFNTDIYFIAQDGEHGFELWKSDGTSEGTLMIKDINPTPNEFGGYPDWLTVVKGSLYFSASDGEHGMELWKSDGTSEGTRMVKDLTPGPNGSDLYWFSNVNERLFFIEGGRLWRSNGTECSTVQITNDAVSFYDAIKPVGSGNKVYFAGVSADAGAELYYYDFSDIDAPGCIQTITFDEIGPKSVTDAPFELHATSSSGLPVSFSVPDTNVVAIEGTKVFIKAAGEVTITATVMASSDYTGTTTEQTIVIAAITGLEEDPGKLVSVYPNPTTDFLVVDGNAMSEGSTVNLLDINGRVLNSLENQTKVDLRDLPNGVYLVRVTTKDFVITKRIIKN
jgi:ELWxxDGT repeat protein